MPTEAQRRAVDEELDSCIDEYETARVTGVPIEWVRERQRQRRQNICAGEVAVRLRELVRLHDWPGTPEELLVALLNAARQQILDRRARYGRIHRDPRMEELRLALKEDRRRRELEKMPIARTGTGQP